MNYIVAKDYAELSRKAANIIASQVILKPDCVLGLATGSSPVGTYTKLAEMCASGDVDFSKVTSVNLDEYEGLDESNDQSYRYFMNANLFDKINIRK
ncbi:MAG: glucosamine-6-phosphate deaminase, partial [Clostridia bacterium]|nr:glucosamine-6-phosphate deaminase [Clostridia bacterium]